MMLSKENTKSLSNYLEDFKKYIVMVRKDLCKLQDIVNSHGELIYNLDLMTRIKIAETIELIEVALIKHNHSYGAIDPIAKVELEEIHKKVSDLLKQTNHDFFIVIFKRLEILIDFVNKNID